MMENIKNKIIENLDSK